MIEKIKKIFKKNPSLKNYKSYQFKPDRDWKIVFFIFLIINIITASYLTSVYLNVLKQEEFENNTTLVETKFINEDSLESVLNNYSKREKNIENLKESVPESKDPSI